MSAARRIVKEIPEERIENHGAEFLVRRANRAAEVASGQSGGVSTSCGGDCGTFGFPEGPDFAGAVTVCVSEIRRCGSA